MRKLLFFGVLLIVFVACNNSRQHTIAELLQKPKAGEMVSTYGEVCHVCHCTSKRCLLVNEKMQCILVEWKDSTKKFSQALMRRNIKVSGTLKSKVLSRKRVEEMLEHAKEHESAVKINESQRILKWMDDKGKSSYTSYYIECLDYKEID